MWSALTAAMLGVIYALLTGWLKDAIGALPNSGSFSRGYGRGPLRLFLIVGGAGGWIMAIIAERIWGWAGAVLFIPYAGPDAGRQRAGRFRGHKPFRAIAARLG